jgi:MFS family permease
MNDHSFARSVHPLQSIAATKFSLTGRLTGGAVVAVLFMGSTLLTPLYDIYRATYDLTVLELGLFYAVYVIGNLIALLLLGRVSDQVGRRPVALASLVLAVLSTLLFMSAKTPVWLFIARIVNGLAVGLGSGAAVAWITEFTPEQRRASAASVMTSFNFVGLALGPMLAGLLVQYEAHPLRLPFEVYLLILAAMTFLVARLPETVNRKQEVRIDLKPRLGVPKGMRLAFAAPAAGGFAAMAIVGFYAALGPSTIQQSLNITNRAESGVIVAEAFIVAMLAILATRNMKPRTTMMIGHAGIPMGVVLLVAAQRYGSMSFMLLSASICGAASALGYRGGLAAVNALAPPEQRAEVASTYFVCCFLGNALPIIGVTALSQTVGSKSASLIFAVVLSLIGIGALLLAGVVRKTR